MLALARARALLSRFAEDVWHRDRARLSWPAALANRVLRIGVWTVRGIVERQLSRQAAALTYYTVFSIIPVLVVTLGILKAFGQLDHLIAAAPGVLRARLANNSPLHSMAHEILIAVNRTLQVTSGIVGLGALLYGVVRLFANVESAVDTVADAGQRKPRYYRLLGYLVLLILPALLVALVGVLVAIASGLSQVFSVSSGGRIIPGALGVLGATWVGLAILYAAAARARIGLAPAATGAAAGTIFLALVLWAFAQFQIGVAKTNAVQSGLAAGPVFLLWVFASWYAVLIGADIAVGCGIDRTLIHGAGSWWLDADGQQAAGLAIMVRVARADLAREPPVTTSLLARELRLFPHLVDPLCRTLVRAGLLVERGQTGYGLPGDPDRTLVSAIIDGLACDPSLDRARREIPLGETGLSTLTAGRRARSAKCGGLTLRDLAEEPPPSQAEYNLG